MPQPSLLGFLQDKDSQQAVGRGLLDAANRGWIAQTFGAPVDMATQAVNLGIAGAGYLGHKAGLFKQPPGLLDSARVPGSSEWIGQKMQNAGMVSPERNPVAEAGMGLLSPVAFKGAQKVGGLLANAEIKAAENLATPSTMRMKAQRGAVMAGEKGGAKMLYHVAPKDHEGPLLSLYKQYGDDAYGMYAKRWPESGNIGQDHAHYVHMHDSLEEANKYAKQYGGKVYSIDPASLADDWIDVVRDRVEYDHPMVRDEIPAEYLRLIK